MAQVTQKPIAVLVEEVINWTPTGVLKEVFIDLIHNIIQGEAFPGQEPPTGCVKGLGVKGERGWQTVQPGDYILTIDGAPFVYPKHVATVALNIKGTQSG